jgi:hypothetical protein
MSLLMLNDRPLCTLRKSPHPVAADHIDDLPILGGGLRCAERAFPV